MMKTTVNVLDIAKRPAQEMVSILRQGSVLRLPHLEARLQMAQERVSRFETIYATTLEDLETQGLPDDAGYQMHEDFIEWEHWHDVAAETEDFIKNMKRMLSKAEEAHVPY